MPTPLTTTAAANGQAAPRATAAQTASANPMTRFVLQKANRELDLLDERRLRLRARFVAAGAAFEDRVQQLDDVAMRLEALKARVLPMGVLVRLANSNYEASQVQDITARMDRIVAA